jgi:hypothetical protein
MNISGAIVMIINPVQMLLQSQLSLRCGVSVPLSLSCKYLGVCLRRCFNTFLLIEQLFFYRNVLIEL